MKHLYTSLLILCLTHTVRAQAILDWAFSAGGPDNYKSDVAYHVATDDEGNVFVTGFFIDSVDFDPGPAEEIRYYDEDGDAAFLAKYSPDMELIFVITAGDNYGEANGTYFNFDSEGNILWTGWVFSSVDFDPGPAEHNLSSVGGVDMFLAKYDSEGNYIWGLSCGGYYYDKGMNILIGEDDRILLTGDFEETVDFDPSGDGFEMTAVDDFDLAFIRYDANGNFIDAKQLNASPEADYFDFGTTTAQDADGNIYLAGMFSQTCDFDMGDGVTEITGYYEELFFAKYDADLNLIWVKQIKGQEESGGRELHGITLDDAGNIYLCGWYEGDIDADPSANEYIIDHMNETADDIFFAKYTNDGDLIWAKAVGGEGFDYARSIALDPDGNVLLVGEIYESVDFDPGPGVAMVNAPLYEDTYIALYDANGNYLNASTMAGGDFSYQFAYATSISDDGSIYVGGSFSQSVDFDCTAKEYMLTSNGDYDYYLAKYAGIEFEPVAIETEEITFSIYPNPADEYLVITSTQINLQHTTVCFYDLSGRLILSVPFTSAIPVADLASGIYMMQIISDENTTTKQISIN